VASGCPWPALAEPSADGHMWGDGVRLARAPWLPNKSSQSIMRRKDVVCDPRPSDSMRIGAAFRFRRQHLRAAAAFISENFAPVRVS
jgi:hypothetical protein